MIDRDTGVRRATVVFGAWAVALGLLHSLFALYGLTRDMHAGPLFFAGGFGIVWLALGLCLLRAQRWAVYVGLVFGTLNMLFFLVPLAITFNHEPRSSSMPDAAIGGTGAAALLIAALLPGLSALSHKPGRLTINLLGVVGCLFAGALSQIIILEILLSTKPHAQPDRLEVYGKYLNWTIACALAGGIAWVLGSFIRGAIGGALTGFITGFLIARILMNFTSGVEGLVQGDIAPYVVIISGPAIGAIVGAVIADKLLARSRSRVA